MNTSSAIVCLAVELLACGAQPSFHTKEPRQPNNASICDEKSARWLASRTAPQGVFTIWRNGHVDPPTGSFAAKDIAFHFADLEAEDEVQLDVTDPNDDAARVPIACGPVDAEQYFKPKDWSSAHNSVVVLELHGIPSEREKDRAGRVLKAASAPLVTALEPAERDEVHRQLFTLDLLGALRAAVAEPTNGSTVTAAGQAVEVATARGNSLHEAWCATHLKSPLAPAVCAEIIKLQGTLESLASILRSAQPPSPDMLKNIKFADTVALLTIPDALSPSTKRKQCQGIALLDWLNTEPHDAPRLIARVRLPWVGSDALVTVKYGQNGDDILDADPDKPYGFLVKDAPTNKPGSFASHQGNVITADVSSILLATIRPVLNAVPSHGIAFTSDSVTAESFNQEFENIAANVPERKLNSKLALESPTFDRLIKLYEQGGRKPPPADQSRECKADKDCQNSGVCAAGKCVKCIDDTQCPTGNRCRANACATATECSDDELCPKRQAPFSLTCPATSASPETTIATGIDPVATIEARAFMFGPLPSKYATDVVACEGSTCSGTSDDKQVRSRRSIVPDQTLRLTLLADVSGSVGLHSIGATAHGSRLSFYGQTAPTFQPVLGAGGSDQIYQLRQEISPQSVFATSLLLGMHVRRGIIGIGPSLLVGANGSLLSQWSVHGGYPLFPHLARNIYLVTGLSVRFVPAPDAYRIGALVDVPIPSSGAPQPPPIATHETGLVQFDIGLAIDIGGLGSALSSTISSLGGGK